MPIKISILIYIAVMAACIVTTVNIYVKARKTPMLYSLIACQTLMFFWLFFAIMENMAENAGQALFIDRIVIFPISVLGGFWLIFALYFCDLITKQNRYIITLILSPLVLLYLPAFTKNYFYLIIENKVIGENGWTEWGIFFKLSYILTLIYSIAGIVLVIRKSLRDYRYIKLRKVLIIVAVLIPLSVNIVASIGLIRTYFDYTPVSFSICFVLFSVAIFKLKLFDITPVAINNIFSSMEEAILILNGENEIVDYNKAALREFGLFPDIRDAKNIHEFLLSLKEYAEDGGEIERLLESYGEDAEDDSDTYYFTMKKSRDGDDGETHYLISRKPLGGESGKRAGSIVSVKNVSGYKKATLEKERGRLSRDLHDTMGSCIMAISANLKYAMEKFGPTEDVLLAIKQAHSSAAGGILYLKRIVEDLSPLDLEFSSLTPKLQSLFEKLEAIGIKIDFHYTGTNAAAINESKYSNIIYKACQEALNNSFSHGNAREVFINLAVTTNDAKLHILDDGVGCANIIKGRGLSGIEKRVTAVGGKVDFGSPTDGGFNIRISIPFNQGKGSRINSVNSGEESG